MAGELTRSRIEAFDQTANQLSQYASRWRVAASNLDQAAQAYVSQIANPSGTQWQGHASAAALNAAHTDQVSVTGAVMHAHDMADIAELGSSSLLGARDGALQAIAQAEADDFTVGEDLSVADNHYHADPATYAARMTQAEAHLAYIEHHAGLLEAENHRIAAQLGAGASNMRGIVPATWTTNGGPKAPDKPRDHKPKIEAVDRTFKRGPDQPPPPDPVDKLGLPDYKPGSLSGEEARAVYAHGELRMRDLNEQLIKQGLNPEDRAKIMFEQRNSLRSWVRDSMQDRAGADWLNENRPNQTWDQSVQKQISRGNQGNAIYNGIIDSSTRSNPDVNAATGINPEKPPSLPPVRPSPPIEAAPAELPPLVERGGEGTMFAGGPGAPWGPQVVPPPHGHPHWIGETPIEEWEEGQH